MTSPFPFLTPPQIDAELKNASDRELESLASEDVPADKGWGGLTDEQRRALRARNELALRRRLANEAAQQQEAARVLEQKREAAAQQQLEQFKQQARSAFPGSAAEFEAAWSDIKRQFQIQQALTAMISVERKAQSDIYSRE